MRNKNRETAGYIPGRCQPMHRPTPEEIFSKEWLDFFPEGDIVALENFSERSDAALNRENLNPNSLVASVLQKYENLDATVLSLREKKQVNFLCKRDCNTCCDNYFYIAAAEYYTIKHYLLSEGHDAFQEHSQRGKALYAQLKKDYPEEVKRLERHSSLTDDFDQDHKNLNRFKMCPFANLAEKRCDIYPVRPIICRLYGTSYSYAYCQKIFAKIKHPFSKKPSVKVQKYMVGIPMDEKVMEGIDYGILPKNSSAFAPDIKIFQRAYPIVYWLAHDEQYSAFYALATTRPKETYWNVVLGRSVNELQP